MSQKHLKPVLMAATLLFMASFNTSASAEMASAEMLAAPCAACHGPKGSSVGVATPTIAGVTQDYFITSMQDYVSGKRKSTVMGRIAKGYSAEEVKALAGYFSQQKIMRITQSFDPALAAKGKPLFQKYCEKCHEEDGYKPDGIGVMAGQTMDYLRFMVADFFSGDREWEKRQAKKMKALMEDHGQEGYEAVIHYSGSKQ